MQSVHQQHMLPLHNNLDIVVTSGHWSPHYLYLPSKLRNQRKLTIGHNTKHTVQMWWIFCELPINPIIINISTYLHRNPLNVC